MCIYTYVGEKGLQGIIGNKGVTGLVGRQGPPGNNSNCVLGVRSQYLTGMQVSIHDHYST